MRRAAVSTFAIAFAIVVVPRPADGKRSPPAAQAMNPGCVPPSDALRSRAAAALAFTDASFKRALASRRLTLVALPSSMTSYGYGASPIASLRPEGTTFSDRGKTFVAGPTINVPSGSIPQPSFEFVRDASGDIWRLVRAPRIRSRASITICDCGPVGSGVAPRTEQLHYELPAGARYRGDLKLRYDARIYALVPSRTDDRGQPCPDPP